MLNNYKKNFIAHVLLLPLFNLPLTISHVFAQDTALGLEEVIVTARKREQSLQDVSVAVTALPESVIKDAQITSSEDLTYLVPSLNLQKGSNPRQTSFNIRGIGTQSFSTAVEPSVSTMLDGVVMGRSGNSFMQLLDVQRIEVLRGPQGTLFGKNSTAGVIHIITKNPTDEHEGEVSLALVEEDEYRGGASFSGPLGDELGYRLTLSGLTMKGYIDNEFSGEKLDNADDWTVRAKLRWQPSDSLELKWTSDYGRRDCNCSSVAIRSLNSFGGNDDQIDSILAELAPVTPGDDNNRVNVNHKPVNDWQSWGHALDVNWDIGEFTLTSITSYREYQVEASTDDDSRPVDVIGFNQSGDTAQDQ
ncbi:MAG: TonB-dependent receptor, partial [Pseudomonadales bacterium]